MAEARDGGPADRPDAAAAHCHFTLTAPRHFLYPAILLLLAEEPRHGYRLVDPLLRFGFGPVDRPSVYRALADLESDGLLTSWEAAPTAGSTRHVYGVTDKGSVALAAWMSVLTEERHNLDRMVARFDHLDGRPTGRFSQLGGVFRIDPSDPDAELGALAAALIVFEHFRNTGDEVRVELIASSEKGFDETAVDEVTEAVRDLPFTMVTLRERRP